MAHVALTLRLVANAKTVWSAPLVPRPGTGPGPEVV